MKKSTIKNVKQLFPLIIFLPFCGLFSLPAFAECGGQIQCIGVGPTPADALIAHHKQGPKTFTLAFGSQDVASVSVSKTVYVAAVSTVPGIIGTMAMLGPVNISGQDAPDFSITGGTCSTYNGPVHDGELCTIEVAFSPATLGAKTATLHVPLDPPACDICVTERTVTLTGMAGILDPSTDSVVGGIETSQMATARRFSRAQISNIHTRLESLHRDKVIKGADVPGFAAGRGSGNELVGHDYATGVLPNHVMIRSDGQEDRSMTTLANALISLASSRSLDLSLSNNLDDQSSSKGIGIWVEGNVNFGARGATVSSNSLLFSTNGVSIGADRQFGDDLIVGLGVGMANDKTNVGTDGSLSQSEATSFFVYGSFQPSKNVYADLLMGHGNLDYEFDRYIVSADDFARGQRDGNQSFASLSASYEYRDGVLLLSPYVRLDSTVAKLGLYTETGAVANAITYSEETLRANQSSIGLRFESAHEIDSGWVLPQLRVEWSHNSEGDRQRSMVYANQPLAAVYTSDISGENNNSMLLGIGSDFVYQNGLKLGVHYRLSRASSTDSDQSIGFWLSKNLDGKSFISSFPSLVTFDQPVQVEAGFMHSDNLNRASITGEELSDQVNNVKVSSKKVLPLSRHTRLLLGGFVSGDRLREFEGLNKVSAGVKAEYQYRTSGAFDAMTLALFGNAAYDNYDSVLRSGNRFSIGLSLQQLLTDKIGFFVAIQNNTRNGEDSVFEIKNNALRLFVDYSLGRSGSLYLGAQYRRGDLVASTQNAVYYNTIALASANDDGFTNQTLIATRYKAETNILTLGYNWPLGPRDSVDVSWENIDSAPTEGAWNVGYTTTRYSLAYIMRF